MTCRRRRRTPTLARRCATTVAASPSTGTPPTSSPPSSPAPPAPAETPAGWAISIGRIARHRRLPRASASVASRIYRAPRERRRPGDRGRAASQLEAALPGHPCTPAPSGTAQDYGGIVAPAAVEGAHADIVLASCSTRRSRVAGSDRRGTRRRHHAMTVHPPEVRRHAKRHALTDRASSAGGDGRPSLEPAPTPAPARRAHRDGHATAPDGRRRPPRRRCRAHEPHGGSRPARSGCRHTG